MHDPDHQFDRFSRTIRKWQKSAHKFTELFRV